MVRLPFGSTKSNQPYRFQELAEYNARLSNGILHAPAYVARMAEEQRLFNEWAARGYPEHDLPPPSPPQRYT